MTSGELRRALLVPLLAAACGGGGSSPTSPATPATPTTTDVVGVVPAGPNVIPIGVSGAGCPPGFYFNEPCVSVTVCVPGTSTCQTIGGLLLDTGSTGLRVFSQALTLPLPRVTAGGAPVGECVAYLDGSSQWGPVARASVVLGGEPAVDVPVQIIDATFSSRPSRCASAQGSPAAAGFNGILGVASFEQDCGPGCAAVASNGFYYACGASCAGTTLPLASQVTNPASALPQDGNGVLVKLPALPAGGARSATGALVLGIGTRANNTPSGSVVALPLDAAGELQSTIGATAGTGFLDTGSNGLFFPAAASPALTVCGGNLSPWFCPAAPVPLSGTLSGARGAPSAAVGARILSMAAQLSADVSAEAAGPAPASAGIDWGLPFHYGRDVFVGFEHRTSVLGAGPLVAF